MKLTVLGSSSAGNGYILQNEDVAILLECGVRFIDVKKALNFNVKKIQFALLTHSHGDHAKYVRSYLDGGVKVFASTETIRETKVSHHNWQHVIAGTQIQVGKFIIKAFDVYHDVKCFGYILQCGDNRICFITDTHFIPKKLSGLTNVIVECNFSNTILNESGTIEMVRKRVSTAHMSLDLCKDWLENSDLSKVNNIVLVHLSDSNSHAEHFKNVIQGATGKVTHIAAPGMTIDFDTRPF